MLLKSHLLWRQAVSRRRSHRRRAAAGVVSIEQLEDRTLLSGADLLEPNNTLATATSLGNVSGHGEVDDAGLSIHEVGDEDWYYFELSSVPGQGHFARIDFDHELGDLDLELYDEEGAWITGSYGVGDSEEISGSLVDSGEFYLRVYGFDGDTNPEYSVSYNVTTLEGDFAEANNAIQDAWELGEVEGSAYWDELSIHTPGDDDWFSFELSEEAGWIHHAAVLFSHDEGDLDLALYDADGNELDSSASTDDFEMVWFDGLPAGSYRLEVYGFEEATNPDYTLLIEAPHETDHESGSFDPDAGEPNNTLATASDLGTVTGFEEHGPWSIHETGDEDWFRFETQGTGGDWDGISISFWHEAGDLDLALYDADGELLVEADGTLDTEWISLDGRPAGEYALQVRGFNGDTNPEYWLTFTAPVLLAPDFAEPNGSIDLAYDLRTIAGLEFLDGLSIDTPGDSDWFRFETLGPATNWHGVSVGEVTVSDEGLPVDFGEFDDHDDRFAGHEMGNWFWNDTGDLELAVYDSDHQLVGNSTGIGSFEFVSLAGLPAGEYFVEVWGFEDTLHPDYVLGISAPEQADVIEVDFAEPNDSLDAAYDLRTIEHDSWWEELSVHESGNEDWFVFETLATGSATDAVAIEFDHELGDLDLALFDSQGTMLGVSEGFRDFEQVSLNGRSAGIYHVRVVGFDGAEHPGYQLGIMAPRPLLPDPAEENDSRETAYDLREVAGESSWEGFSIHTADDEDWFTFELIAEASWAHAAGIDFWHASGDLELSLHDSTGTLIESSTGIDDGEELTLAGLTPGTYYLHVSGFDGSTSPDYQLWIDAPHGSNGTSAGGFLPDYAEPNDVLAEAYDLREIEGQQHWEHLSIHAGDDVDWFRFTLLAGGTVHHFAAIEFEHAEGDLDLALFDIEGHELSTADGVTDFEEISLAGWPAGVYHLEVSGWDGAVSPDYRLVIEAPRHDDEPGTEIGNAADSYEPNDAIDTATNLRVIEGQTAIEDLSIHTTVDTDWFTFTTTTPAAGGHSVRIEFAHHLGDLDLALHDQHGLLAESDSVEDLEAISLEGLDAGTYWIEVFGYSGQTNPEYRLVIDAPVYEAPAPDRLEPNNTLAEATLVRSDDETLAGAQRLTALSIHSDTDEDLFAFTTVATGTTAHGVSVSYRNGDGDLVLELLDATGTAVAETSGSGGYASLSLDGFVAATWHARVSGLDDDANVYDIAFDTPSPGTQNDSDAWTVMVYLTASNLESFAFNDINEMEQAAAQLPGSVNLSVLWDQSAAGQVFATAGGSQAAWGTTGRAFIDPDTDLQVVATEFELLGEQNTGHPDTLGNFIDWTVSEAPAEHYALILWDHGSGLQGFNYDDSDGGLSDHLTTPELVDVLDSPGRPRIDLVAFDACLMAMAEVGFSLRDLTDVFVASQEVVGAEGHDYRTLFSTLEDSPDMTSAQALATGFVASYEEQYEGSYWGWDTQSAVVTDGYQALATALEQFVDTAVDGTGLDLDVLREARDDAITYDISFLRDLGSFVAAVADNNNVSATLQAAAIEVEDTILAMRVAQSEDARESSGISVFLPDNATSAGAWYTTPYSAFDQQTGWSQLLGAMGGNGRGDGGSGSGRSVVSPDWSEQNDVAAQAFNLNTLVGSENTFPGLGLHATDDVDWFRLTLGAPGGPGNAVTTTPTGDSTAAIRLTLWDSAGTSLLETSQNGPGPQMVSLDGLAAGDYLLRADSPQAGSITGYDLIINAPDGDASSDWAGENSSQDKAWHLGTIGNSALFSGLGVSTAAEDWFTFDTPRRVGSALYALDVSAPQGHSLTVALQDAAGTTVASTSGDGLLDLQYTASGSGEQYTLLVTGGQTTIAYSLHFEPIAATVAVDLDAAGNLVVTDTSRAGQDDHVIIRTDGNDVWVETPDHVSSATIGTAVTPHVIRVPLTAVPGAIRVHSGPGDDWIEAGQSQVPLRLMGGIGDDTLEGGSHNDVLNGGGGHDALDGAAGNDRLLGGGGRDIVAGGPGADFLSGQGGEDHLEGNDGDDTLNGDGSNDRLLGGPGHDRLNGGAGHDRINGAAGNDTAFGGIGHDVLHGGRGRDWLDGGAGRDRQFGQGAPDTLVGGAGSDLLDGGISSDELRETGDFDFQLTNSHLTGRGIDVHHGIERARIIGGDSDNILDASAFTGSVVLAGEAGNDLIKGGTGADRLVAGPGDDTLEGNAGNDRLFGGRGQDQLTGGPGDDFLRGQQNDDSIAGGTGDDTLNGEHGDDVLLGGLGDDVLRGGSGDDWAMGEEGADYVYGQVGHDSLCINGQSAGDVTVGHADEIDVCLSLYSDWIEV